MADPVILQVIGEGLTLQVVEEETTLSLSASEVTLEEELTIPVTVLEVGGTGPAGGQGPAGEDAEDLGMKYRTVTDQEEDTPSAGQTTIYKGWSPPGAGDQNEAVWKIQRMVLNDEDDIIESGFAGTGIYDQVWDDRVSLGYS